MIIGVLLSTVSIVLIFATNDNNLRRYGLVLSIGGLFALGTGVIQYLSYALRSERGKAAYRAKWGARGLYHSLIITAVSNGTLTNNDIEYIKRIYRKTFLFKS